MALTSTEQSFIERPLEMASCLMITYHIYSKQKQPLEVFCKKRCSWKLSCEFCEIFKNTSSTEHLRVTASVKNVICLTIFHLSRVFFYWRFVVYFISTEKWNKKREIPWWSSNIYFFLEYRLVWREEFQKKFDRW